MKTRNIKRKCIPSTGCETHQLRQGILQCPGDPDTETYRVNPETLKRAEAQGKALENLRGFRLLNG